MSLIRASVGRGGVNRPQDVRLVQVLLYNHVRPPRQPLRVDGLVSPGLLDSGYTYTLFDTYEGDITPPLRQQGVQVTWPASRKDASLLCRQAAVGNLRDLSTVVRCDPESPLNFGNCP